MNDVEKYLKIRDNLASLELIRENLSRQGHQITGTGITNNQTKLLLYYYVGNTRISKTFPLYEDINPAEVLEEMGFALAF